MREEKKYATSSQPPDHIAHLHHQEVFVGPSGVRALPLAAGINEGGHYFGPSVLRAPAEQTKVATVGPSGAVQTVSDSRRPLF